MKITEATFGRFNLRAGKLNGKHTARAFRNGARAVVAETEGNTDEEALHKLKKLLSDREKERRTSRRLIERLKFHVPTIEEFAEAIEYADLHPWELDMLAAHARAGDAGLTPIQIAKAGGYNKIANANALYGKVGRKIGEQIGIEGPRASSRPGEDRPTGILATYEADPQGGETEVWVMHPELRRAVVALKQQRIP